MVVYEEDEMGGSPSSIPVVGVGSKELSDLGLNMNLSKAFDNASSFDDGNVDIELDEAVQRALGESMDDTASQSTDSGVYTHEEELSVFSDAKTESSSKSAVQLRLERRKKAATPTKADIKRKQAAAAKRRKSSISFVIQRASEHFKDAKKTAKLLESKNKSDSESILEKLERKMNLANERKEQHLQSIAVRYQEKYDKAYMTKSRHEKDAREIQRKLDNKLSLAAERKEKSLRDMTSKLHDKSELISYSLSRMDLDDEDNKDKLKQKLNLAKERKEKHLESITHKIQGQRKNLDDFKQKQEVEVQEIQSKIDRKMNFAALRKEKHLQSLSFKSIGNLDRVLSARSLFDDETEAKKERNDKKIAFANMRKEEHIQKVISKNQDKLNKASENREMQTKMIQEKVDKKLSLATERKEQHLQGVAGKALQQLNKVSSSRSLLDEKIETDTKATQEILDKKLSDAAKRKGDHLQNIATKNQNRLEKASENRDMHTKAVQEKVEQKLQLAAERKEQHIQEVATKAQDRLDKVSNTKRLLEWRAEQKALVHNMMLEAKQERAYGLRDIESQSMTSVQDKIERAADSRELQTKALEEKVDSKLLQAAQRKEQLMSNISNKIREKMNKIEVSKIQHEEETKAVQEKLDAKQTLVAERKQQIALEIAAKNQAKMQKAADNRESQTKAVQEKVETKLNNAAERKEQHIQNISNKASEKLEKISNAKIQHETDTKVHEEKLNQKLSQASERKEQMLQSTVGKNKEKLDKATETREQQAKTVQEKVEKRLTQASERKDNHIQSIVSKNKEKNDKIYESLYVFDDDESVVSTQEELEMRAAMEKLDKKLAEAAERRASRLQNMTTKLHHKMERVSSNRSFVAYKQETEVQSIQEKNEEKQALAIERKDNQMKEKQSKIIAKMEKISENKKSTQMKLKELGERFAQKMTQANIRKNISSNESRGTRTEPRRKLDEEELEARKQKLEEKLFSAAERKQDQLDEKAAKAAAYISTTIQKGLEAMKRKEEASVTGESITGEESFICEDILPLTSINEDDEYDQGSVFSANLSVTSSSSTKSKVQLRLEKWQKPTITKQKLNAKLNAATSRRKLAIIDVQEKAGIGSKLEKTSKKMLSTHDALKKLEEKFTEKMFAANRRKEEKIMETVEKATVSKKREEDVAKVSAMQQKLEDKLLAAIQRKEKIISSRARKAGGKVSLSTERGQSALKQREELVERVKTFSKDKIISAKDRRNRLKELEKEKKEVNMMRRVMTQKMEDGIGESGSLSSLQEKLERKLQAASERKKNYLAAKSSKAGDHVSSSSERGLDILKQRQSSNRQLKVDSEDKHELAAKRKAALEEEKARKEEERKKRREVALEMARQKKLEQEMIAKWEARSVLSQERLPVLNELQEDDSSQEDNVDKSVAKTQGELMQRRQEVADLQEADTDDAVDYPDIDQIKSEDTYDSRKLAARRMLAEEIRRANEVKTTELTRIAEERRENERRERARREMDRPEPITKSDNRSMSIGTIGSIDSNDLCSFDEEDISISGLSTVREEESKIDRRKAQAALALAELDIKLSEIQIMQAILLAEEASLNGQSEFKTSEKSISDLNNVKVSINVSEDENGVKKVKKQAQNFFNYTMKSAKDAQKRAGVTIGQMRRKGIFKLKKQV